MKKKIGLKAQTARWNYLGRELQKDMKKMPHYHKDDSGTFACPLGSACAERVPFIEWKKLPRSHRAIVNGYTLDVWPFTISDNTSIMNVYRWTITDSGGVYLDHGDTQTDLDSACESAIKAAYAIDSACKGK